jgi:hypothetical protein
MTGLRIIRRGWSFFSAVDEGDPHDGALEERARDAAGAWGVRDWGGALCET